MSDEIKKDDLVVLTEPDEAVKVINPGEDISLGEWYWLNEEDYEPGSYNYMENRGAPDGFNRLVCVTEIGSNYVKVSSPRCGKHRSASSWRVHFDKANEELLFEPNHQKVISFNIEATRNEISLLVNRMNEACASIGIDDKPAEDTSKALAIVSSSTDIKVYENQLAKIKEEVLPEIKDSLDQRSYDLASWMSAETTSMEVTKSQLEKQVGLIDERIHNVSLYAGLDEDIEHIREGKVASADEVVNIMQRLHYMDEESLMDVDRGGMEFDDIGDFDKWLARPANFKRLLPAEKCICSFRVRRNTKDRGPIGSTVLQWYIRFWQEKEDMYTYLYVRNGENLYRLSTTIEFNESLFPDTAIYTAGQPLMFKGREARDMKFITVGEWEARVKEKEELSAILSDREKFHSKGFYTEWEMKCQRNGDYDPDYYKPFNDDNIYYDDAVERMRNDLKIFNKTGLVVQGIFDRTSVLQPIGKVSIMKGSEPMVKLVYDNYNVLTFGEPPSIEEYLEEANKNIAVGSICVGQLALWRKAGSHFEEDNGPETYHAVDKLMPRAKKVIFAYERDESWRTAYKRTGHYYPTRSIRTTFKTDIGSVLDLNGYEPGDYKRFFEDPRTRANYLEWAHLLFEAEDYWAKEKGDVG